MSYFLSVDLGTTFSAAAINEDGRVEIFSLGSRSAVVPSVVALRADGTVLTGEPAERRGASEPTRVGREFKRRLGDPTPMVIGGTPYGAEALMAELLRAIVARVTEQKVERPTGVVLSHPANYGPYKLDLLAQVGHLAEVANVTFIPEPEAAAVHYLDLDQIEPGAVVAVYDLGGGTFDVALVRRTETGFEPVGTPDGMERFGGIDLDEAVFDHVRRSLGRAMDGLDPDDQAVTSALVRLREDCRLAKEALSSDTDAAIVVMLPNLHTEVRLTRAEFEDLIRPRLRETMRLLERVVRSSGLQFDDLAQVLLVGGSSRIPLVAEMVGEATGRPVTLGAHPKHAIALGAASAGHVAGPPDAEVVDEPVDVLEGTPAAAKNAEVRPEVDEPADSELDPVPVSQQPAAAAESEPDGLDSVSPHPPAPTRTHRSSRRWLLVGAVALTVAVGAVVGTVLLSDRGTADDALPPDEGGPGLLAEFVVPVRVAITHGDAVLMLAGGASWEPMGPIEVSEPTIEGSASPEAIVISRRSDAGPLAEAIFEVAFHDVEEAVRFIVERSDPGVVVEIAFPASPEQWGFVADGDHNPVEFEVLRDHMSG